MKNIFKKIGLVAGISGALLLGILAFSSPVAPLAQAQTANFWTQNALNSLATNTSGGLANADIHVRHCYIGLGTGTPCGGGGGTIGGSIASTQVAFGSGANTISGDNNLTWDGHSFLSLIDGIFEVGSVPLGGDLFSVDASSNEVIIGDGGGALTGAFIIVNATNGTSTVVGQKGLQVQDTNGGNNFLNANPVAELYGLGDLNNSNHGTSILMDDTTANQSTTFVANNKFLFTDNGGNLFGKISKADQIIEFGDLDGTGAAIPKLVLNGATAETTLFSPLNMDTNRITNMADPVLAQDSATKAYVDAFVSGLSWKNASAVATVAPLPTVLYANGASGVGATLTCVSLGALTAIDGYSPLLGDRILVKDQVSQLENGIYTVTVLGNVGTAFVLTRATDNDTTAEMAQATTSITNGTVNGNTAFTQVTATPTMGATAIVWNMFLNGTYTAGSGLSLIGHAFSLNVGHANNWTSAQLFDSGFFQMQGSTSGILTMSAANTTTPYSLKWPSAQGAANSFLKNDGAGNLTWATGIGSGSVTSITPGVGLSDSADCSTNTAITTTGTLYGCLSTGKAGGQTIIGGRNPSDTLTLSTTTSGLKGKMLFGTSAYDEAGNRLGIGTASPTAALELKAGTATAGTGPLKFTSGTNLTTAEAGSMEYNGTNLFMTNGGAQRQEIPQIQQTYVSSQFNTSSNTTFVNVPALTADVVAGHTYRFEAVLYTTCPSTPGCKFAIGGTNTPTSVRYYGVSTTTGSSIAVSAGVATSLGTSVAGAAQAYIGSKINGTITVTTGGTLTVQFAQFVSNGSNSSILTGSTFVVTQIN